VDLARSLVSYGSQIIYTRAAQPARRRDGKKEQCFLSNEANPQDQFYRHLPKDRQQFSPVRRNAPYLLRFSQETGSLLVAQGA
jgi:hypothetical protein